MTEILNFALKIKGGGREGDTCEVLRPCHPPKKFGFGTCTGSNMTERTYCHKQNLSSKISAYKPNIA